jgi:2-haloacid dehalogenase
MVHNAICTDTGTILDPSSMQAHLADRYPDSAATLTSLWRRYQLEYTWRATCQETYEPFETITKKALAHAVAECSENIAAKELDEIMGQYEKLDMYLLKYTDKGSPRSSLL